MNNRISPLVLCLMFVLLLSCNVLAPSMDYTPTQPGIITNFPEKPTSTSLPSPTSHPTFTSVPTRIFPILTPTTALTFTPSPTSIPLQVQLSIFESFWSIVNDTYVYPDFNGLDWATIHQEFSQQIEAGLTNDQFYQGLSDLVTRLGDDHSFFLDPLQVAQQEAEYQGKHDYVGIGVLVSAVPERQHAVILAIFPGSPAEEAGLQPRDSIMAVDGVDILDEYGYLRDIVRGPEGSTISIIVQTPGQEPRQVSITRHRITGNSPVVHNVITTPAGKRIGYILLVTFEDSTVDEQVAVALREMTVNAPLDGLILDNRMNGGGSSDVLEPMLSYFVSGKLGYFVQQDNERPLQVKGRDINGSLKVPLVVLTGNETASFGEIFAGVLKDMDRAYLIGQNTQGKVEILWGYDLQDGSQLWLANETFRPLNHPEQDWKQTGVIPDQIVNGAFDQFTQGDDPAVLAAVDYLSRD